MTSTWFAAVCRHGCDSSVHRGLLLQEILVRSLQSVRTRSFLRRFNPSTRPLSKAMESQTPSYYVRTLLSAPSASASYAVTSSSAAPRSATGCATMAARYQGILGPGKGCPGVLAQTKC